jgi:hypothetical protein
LVRRFHVHNEIGHLLIYYGPDIPEKNVDRITQLAAEIYAYKYQQKDVVVIAATDELKQYKFGMFKAYDTSSTPEAIERLESLIWQFGWFKMGQRIKIHDTEFPE